MTLQFSRLSTQPAAPPIVHPASRRHMPVYRESTETRTLSCETYVAFIGLRSESIVVGYETPLHGDLIPVSGGFDYYPAASFWKSEFEEFRIHLSGPQGRHSLQIQLWNEG